MRIKDTKANKIFMIISLIIVIILMLSPKIARRETSESTISLDNRITIEASSANINIWVDESLNKASVVYKTKDSSILEIETDKNGNTLIKEKQKNKLINIKFDNETPTISLYLPTNKVKDLTLKSINGTIETFHPLIADNFAINSTSGDVRLFDVKTNQNLDVNTVSADIYLEQIISNIVSISSTSGDIDIDKIEGSQISLNNISGDIDIYSIIGNKLDINSISSDVFINSSSIRDAVSIKTVSGDVEVIDKDNIYKFNAISDNGEIEINDSLYNNSFTTAAGVPFDIKSVSGEIELIIK